MYENKTNNDSLAFVRFQKPSAERYRPIVNGFLIALYFAISLDLNTKRTATALFIAISYFIYNRSYLRTGQPANGVNGSSFFSPSKLFGIGLLAINVGIFSWQTISLVGTWRDGVKMLVLQSVLVVMSLRLVWLYRPRYVKSVLLTLALAFAWFAVLNLVAGRLGLENPELMEREQLFTSRYVQGSMRFQTALYSAWQISGLLRWAVPIILLCFWLKELKGLIPSLVTLGLSATGAVVIVLVEYRAAVFPFFGLLFWIIASNVKWRTLLSIGYLWYAVIALLLFGQFNISQVLVEILPNWVQKIGGDQDIADMASLSGRDKIWIDGASALASGKHLLFGTGHLDLDAREYVSSLVERGPNAALKESTFQRVSFHQGVLDILFIYGSIPGSIIVGALLWTSVSGVFLVWNLKGWRGQLAWFSDVEFALLALGMVGLSNCHDGFFVGNNFFYFVTIVSCWAISDASKEASRL